MRRTARSRAVHETPNAREVEFAGRARTRRAQGPEGDPHQPAQGQPGSSGSTSWPQRLAEAVAARPRALVLDADNRSQGWIPLEEAWALGSAYAVVMRTDLFCVDLDLDRDALVRQGAFGQLVDAIEAAGGRPVVWASGRPGHRHLVVAMTPGPDRGALEVWAKARALDVRGTARPPLSPHRLGLPVHLASPLSEGAALGCLDAPVDPASVLRALGQRGLSARMRMLVHNGHEAVGYPSASEGRMALAVALRAGKSSMRYLQALLEDERHALGETYRARSVSWRSAELSRLWQRAGSYLTANAERARGDAETVARWCQALRSEEWRGMGGATDLAIAEEVGRRALASGRTRVLLPLTTAALGAGVSVSTARRGLRRLVAKGWLVLAQAPSPTCASVYALVIPGAHETSETGDAGVHRTLARTLRPVWEARGGDLGADMARWRALGKSAVRVLRELSGGPLGLAELAVLLSVTTSTVRAHLRRLAAVGLVTECEGRWQASPFDGDEVAERFGTRGCRSRDAATYAAARQARIEARRARAQWRRASARDHLDAPSNRGHEREAARQANNPHPLSVRLIT